MEEALARSVWTAEILIRFSLASEDILIDAERPPDLFICAPRWTFLPSLEESICERFGAYSERCGALWFDVGGCILPWQYPIGILADALCAGKRSYCGDKEMKLGGSYVYEDDDGEEGGSDEFVGTMSIRVHFRNYPSRTLLPLDSNETMSNLRWWYFNSLKESLQTRFHHCRPVQRLSKYETDSLWRAVSKVSFESFQKLMKKMFESENGGDRALDISSWKRYPVRVIMPAVQSGEDVPHDDPDKQPSWILHVSVGPDSVPHDGTVADLCNFLALRLGYNCSSRIRSCGIELLPETPLSDLFVLLCAPDQFAYVEILGRTGESG